MKFIDRIMGILEGIDGISHWKINEVNKYSEEVFFIKKTLDMNRSKDVHVALVTVYVAFKEEDNEYLGQSSTEIAETMTDVEIKGVLEDTKLGATFVKNQYYELPDPSDETAIIEESNFAKGPLLNFLPELTQSIYQGDTHAIGGINSAEIFLNKVEKRIINSKGIDVSFTCYDSLVEVITEWNEGTEPVESFSIMKFGDYMPQVLTENVNQLINDSKDRAQAKVAKTLKDIPVILSGEAVKEFFDYYMTKTNARAIYEKVSAYKIGDNVQGDSITGDLLSIELLPYLKGSSQSAPYDKDGVLLKPLSLIEAGVVKAFYGELQFTSYLDLPTTGSLSNMKVSLGSIIIEEMMKEPYVELLAFSAFQMSPISGDFGGEVRLAKYFDGKQVVYLSGGAISSNIKMVQSTMTFSKEITAIDNYVGPKHIIFKDLVFAGK